MDIFDVPKCIFRSKGFDFERPAVTSKITSLDLLLGTCEQHNDTVGKTLLKHKSAITNKPVTFRYHKGCRSQYVYDVCETEANNKAASGIHDPTCLPAEYKFTRSHVTCLL